MVQVQSIANSDDRSMIDVVVRICNPGLVGDRLKDSGTAVARAIKDSPVSDRVASLRVTNVAEGDSPVGRIRCEDFALNTFSTEADQGAVRAGWKYPGDS